MGRSFTVLFDLLLFPLVDREGLVLGQKGHQSNIDVLFVLFVPNFVLFLLVLFDFLWTRYKKDSDTPPYR